MRSLRGKHDTLMVVHTDKHDSARLELTKESPRDHTEIVRSWNLAVSIFFSTLVAS